MNDVYSANRHSCIDVDIQRRHFFDRMMKSALANGAAACVLIGTTSKVANAVVGENLPDQFNVDDYLKTGMVMNPMGVSGQAGTFRCSSIFFIPRHTIWLLYSHHVVFFCHSNCIISNQERVNRKRACKILQT
jgi:hypothetical protein